MDRFTNSISRQNVSLSYRLQIPSKVLPVPSLMFFSPHISARLIDQSGKVISSRYEGA